MAVELIAFVSTTSVEQREKPGDRYIYLSIYRLHDAGLMLLLL
jgi:hypothetical protein